MPTSDPFDDHVTDHYEDPYHRGQLDGLTHVHEAEIPICDDFVRIELRVTPAGEVAEAWFEGHGCVASQASASMLVEHVEGMSVDQVRAFSAAEMLELFGPQLPPSRQKCCLLGWRVLQEALNCPVDDDPDQLGPSFGGPSLSEEC